MAMRHDDADAPVLVTTGADGRWTASGLRAGRYSASGGAAGFVPKAHATLELAAGQHARDVDFALVAGGTAVHGTVTDIGGGPVAGAQLAFVAGDMRRMMRGDNAIFGALTAADGTYQLSLPDGDWFGTAKQPGLSRPGMLSLHARRQAGRDRLRPRPRRRDPRARRHAPRRARPQRAGVGEYEQNDRFGMAMLGGVTATSDASGAFQLKPVGSGTLSVSASGRGVATKTPTLVDLGIAGQADDVRVVVEHAPTLSGFVVDKAGAGVPAQYTSRCSRSLARPVSIPLPTRAHGEVRRRSSTLPAGHVHVERAERRHDARRSARHRRIGEVDVTGLKVVIDRGVTLRGTVQPAASATVSLQIDPTKIGFGNMFDAMKAMGASAQTDEAGAFEIKHAPTGELELGDRGGWSLGQAADRRRRRSQRARGPALMRGAIGGRVVDPTGAPVARVDVRARVTDASHSAVSFSAGNMNRNTAQTGDDGTFRITGLDTGTYTLAVADGPGYLAWGDATHKDKPHEAIVVDVPTPAEVTGVTLTIEARDGTIRGKCRCV